MGLGSKFLICVTSRLLGSCPHVWLVKGKIFDALGLCRGFYFVCYKPSAGLISKNLSIQREHFLIAFGLEPGFSHYVYVVDCWAHVCLCEYLKGELLIVLQLYPDFYFVLPTDCWPHVHISEYVTKNMLHRIGFVSIFFTFCYQPLKFRMGRSCSQNARL